MTQEYECQDCGNYFYNQEQCPQCGCKDLYKISRELDSEEDTLQI